MICETVPLFDSAEEETLSVSNRFGNWSDVSVLMEKSSWVCCGGVIQEQLNGW